MGLQQCKMCDFIALSTTRQCSYHWSRQDRRGTHKFPLEARVIPQYSSHVLQGNTQHLLPTPGGLNTKPDKIKGRLSQEIPCTDHTQRYTSCQQSCWLKYLIQQNQPQSADFYFIFQSLCIFTIPNVCHKNLCVKYLQNPH